ncbi:interleukin-15 receptor subunit alpha-like isoform X4 [Heterodontus francisci]|uniref:interleukin-15 receptor subunit alpha-like isoform X4 n=1 Tax=Heterodontus francisci TaxID=7792 RepID=UPI00355BAB28
MAWIKQLLLLCSVFQATFASKGSCSKPNFNVANVDMSKIMDTHFEVGRKLRLKCQSGYKRKAGTSNLIQCQSNAKQAIWSEPKLMCITMTSLATSVEPTSVDPTTSAATARSLSGHYTTSTMEITVTSALGSHSSPATTTLTTAQIKSKTLTATSRPLSGCNRTSSIPPGHTDPSGLGPLATTRTPVRPSTSSASTAETEFPAATALSDSTQKAAAETTVTYSTNNTTGAEPITSRTALAERTVKSSTAAETASDITATIGTADINQTITSGQNIGLIVGTSTGSIFIITLCILFLVWSFLFKKKISCTRPQEHELAPMELLTVTNINETEPLQQKTES